MQSGNKTTQQNLTYLMQQPDHPKPNTFSLTLTMLNAICHSDSFWIMRILNTLAIHRFKTKTFYGLLQSYQQLSFVQVSEYSCKISKKQCSHSQLLKMIALKAESVRLYVQVFEVNFNADKE